MAPDNERSMMEYFAQRMDRMEQNFNQRMDRQNQKLDTLAKADDVDKLEDRVLQVELHQAKQKGGTAIISWLVAAIVAFFTALFTSGKS